MAIAGILVGVKFYLDSANELVTVSSQMFCLFFFCLNLFPCCVSSAAHSLISFFFFLFLPLAPFPSFFTPLPYFECPLVYFHELVIRLCFSNSCELVQRKDSGVPNKLKGGNNLHFPLESFSKFSAARRLFNSYNFATSASFAEVRALLCAAPVAMLFNRACL